MAEEPEYADSLPQTSEKTYVRTKNRRPYSKLQVDLEAADLTSKGVHKMLLGEIERLTEENSRLQSFENSFHERDKRCAVLEAQTKHETMLEILYTVAIAVGAALLGWLPSSTSAYGSWVVAISAILLFVCALMAKWKKA